MMGFDLQGYSVIDIIRKNAGSPATYYEFSKFNNNGSMCHALQINVIGSNNVFVSFSGTALVNGGSTFMMIYPQGTRNLDYRTGSISIASSGGNYNTEIEVVGLGI